MDAAAVPDGVQVRCELQESYRGAILVSDLSHARPLPSRRIAGTTAAAGSSKAPHRGGAAALPLGQAIAAANTALEERAAVRAAKHLASCLADMCERLRRAAPASELKRSASSGELLTPSADGGAAGAAAEAAGAGGKESEAADDFVAVSLLRRLLLWPVDAALLRDTGAGKLVARLKKHASGQVRRSFGQCTE